VNLLDPQVRPPLPHKLPFTSIHEISGSKLKPEEEEEETDYVSETLIFDSSLYSSHKNEFVICTANTKVYVLLSINMDLKVHNSEVCHPRCVFKLYGEVNSVKNTTINIWLNDGVY